MESDQIDARDLLKLLRVRLGLITAIVTVTAGSFLAAAYIIPKKYKSSTVITIYNKYFHIPLIKALPNFDEYVLGKIA